MDDIMIARVLSQDKRLLGFVMASEYYRCYTITYEDLFQRMANGKHVQNLGIKDNKIVGTSGKLERYTALNTKLTPMTKQSIVYIKTLENTKYNTYVFLDYAGHQLFLKDEGLINLYYSDVMVANAKVSISSKGNCYLALISGAQDNEIVQEIRLYKPLYSIPHLSQEYCNSRVVKTTFEKILRLFKSSKSCIVFSMINGTTISTRSIYSEINPKALVSHKMLVLCRCNFKDEVEMLQHSEDALLSIGNEILYFKNDAEKILMTASIIELKYLSKIRFLVTILHEQFYFTDILFIGDGLTRLSNPNIHGVGDDYRLIGLGISGIIILKLNEKLVNNSLNFNIIPYFIIKNTGILEELLKKYKIDDAIGSEQKKKIAEVIRGNEIDVGYIKSLSVLPQSKREFKIEKNGQGLIGVRDIIGSDIGDATSRLNITKIEQGVLYREISALIPEYHMISIQGKLVVKRNYTVGFNERAYTVDRKEYTGLYFNKLNIGVEYAGFYGLYTLGIIQSIELDSLKNEYAKYLESFIIKCEIEGDRLFVATSICALEFDKDILIDIYNKKVFEQEEMKGKVNRTLSKSRIIGEQFELTSDGMLVGWRDGAVVKVNDSIKGIMITAENKHKLTLDTDRFVNIVTDGSYYISHNNAITIRLNNDIKSYIKDIIEHTKEFRIHISKFLTFEIDLRTSSFENILFMLEMVARSFVTKTNINYYDYNIKLDYLFYNASELFDFENIVSDRKFVNFLGINEVDQELKNRLLTTIIKSLLLARRRNAKVRACALELFKKIVSFICNNNEVDMLCNNAQKALEKSTKK